MNENLISPTKYLNDANIKKLTQDGIVSEIEKSVIMLKKRLDYAEGLAIEISNEAKLSNTLICYINYLLEHLITKEVPHEQI